MQRFDITNDQPRDRSLGARGRAVCCPLLRWTAGRGAGGDRRCGRPGPLQVRFVTLRVWQLALLAAVIGLAIGGGRGVAQEGTPPSGDHMTAHHLVFIRQGTCAQPNPQPAFTLTEIAMDMAEHGTGPTIPVEISATTIDAKLTDLLAQPYEIDIHEVKELGEATGVAPIACGDIGGQPTGDVIAIGIKAVDASGFSGIAVLQAAGDQTAVTLYMVHDLAGAMQDETTEASTTRVAFHIPTITCGGCQARVEASLAQVPGILEVHIEGQDVTVIYDPSQVTPEQIQAAIESGGDTVEPLGA